VYTRPFQRNLENYNAIFRKTWMKVPLYAVTFGCAFYGGMQLPARVFPKFTRSKFEGVDHAYYTSSQDIVGKFRLFDSIESLDSRDDVATYLSIYSTQPLTKNEMMDNLALHALKEFDVGKMFRVKRAGKDRDPLFWSFGKIHGLENLAFADEAEVKATNGNPVKLQQIVDRADPSKLHVHSFEHLVQELEGALKEYRDKVETMGMNPSDRKKVLSLPFFLSKRTQHPDPRAG
jgi:multidrug efflux pump subunit AcrB